MWRERVPRRGLNGTALCLRGSVLRGLSESAQVYTRIGETALRR